MTSNAEITDRADTRGTHRASMYLAACLYSDTTSSPVRIRNMSVSGALVQAAVVPRPSSAVRLIRGSLVVDATVAWSDEGRCGLQFSGSVDVQQWLASPTNTEQQRVDEAVRLIKAGAVPFPVASLPRCTSGDHPATQIAEDLFRTSALLQALGDALACDYETVVRHAGPLQNLDIATQTLTALAKAVINGSSDPAIVSKLDHLRRSAAQALDASRSA